ncbi:polyribonucleotide nucleotidyltransferase [Pseudomonas sp. CDFA 602]|uniref:polyribonucleotide nucleotidyltransferase n=1 Tax=Pseudomonas californiensis TaxID=2829823 RepID=UPI001E290AC4|nr:polyribonucleotide nucleotidyltransferase [Pseudomonas californiensis]MCD5996642.1 polyribonucleotide nucleotidyltransferase [Pseudomonas californiensis]MCD6002287.1 polyribonucleotide nucleotidyltransferase [Pseudomonas californiensis]
MRSFSLKAIVMCMALVGIQGIVTVQAATKQQAAAPAAAAQKASLLGGKLTFTLPAGYVQGEMPEIDAKAKAQGVTGALYSNSTEKRVVIVTEAPIPMDVKASDNDSIVLDGLATGTLTQQSQGYKDFKKLGEKKIVKKNGLGIRQLDTSATMSDAKVLSTTIVAASGTRAAVLNVVSNAKNPKEHAALVKAIIGQ